jgi:glycosyltransferase involved in cell wall biosynthesis
MNNVTVLINTLNEEKNIKNCLETVKWADEIIIVDMYSDDRTVEIAREYTDKIYMHERLGYADPARQFALDQATNDWILFVDADELVPVELKNKLLEIAQLNEYDAVRTPHRNFFFGKEMKGAGWGPHQDTHIRFFKRNKMTYTGTVHNFAQLDKTAKVFIVSDPNLGFIHFGMKTIEQYLEKLNRYTTLEAINDYKGKVKFSIVKTLLKSSREFMIRYFFQQGYKDGFYGLALSLFMFMYRIVVDTKLFLMYRFEGNEPSQKIQTYYDNLSKKEAEKYE